MRGGCLQQGRAYNAPRGAIAQLGERLVCNQEVAGSIPAGSINGSTRRVAGSISEGSRLSGGAFEPLFDARAGNDLLAVAEEERGADCAVLVPQLLELGVERADLLANVGVVLRGESMPRAVRSSLRRSISSWISSLVLMPSSTHSFPEHSESIL